MQIWQEVTEGDYALRDIGGNLSLRKFVGAQRAMLHFDGDRSYFDERLARHGPGRMIDFAYFSIRRETLVKLLAKLDAGRPALVAAASKLAAVTQAKMEAEAAEKPDTLPMA